MSVLALAQAEREDLAAFLATLALDQWDAPSLCAGWRVRDVVAHIVSYEGLGLGGLASRLVSGRLVPDRINAVGVEALRQQQPDELIALLREHSRPSGLTAGFGGRIALLDGLIHHQDIRRALGLQRTIPADRLRAALPFALVAPPIKALWHIRGVTVVATDIGWSGGAGPEAHGTGEAVLMVMGGRRGVARELSGPGAQRLIDRQG